MKRLLLQSHSEKDNIEIAQNILSVCKTDRIFAFFGNLGAGKTTLIKSICRELGVTEDVTSPTFTLVNEYEGTDCTIYHFDFYRMKSEEEAYDIGCEEYFYSDNYCFIEWPEKIPSVLPEEAVLIRIETTPDNSREIEITYG